MMDTRSSSRGDDKHVISMESPPMSRLFVVCSKSNTEKDLREAFEKCGHIEDIWLVKDKHTGENKGVGYVKFSKTSEAARAIDELDGICIGEHTRAIRVLVAESRDSISKKSIDDQEKCLRLFVIVSKSTTETELKEDFIKYGDIMSVSIVRDRKTGEGKGYAYVRFKRFYHAALAFEGCQDKYKAVFAKPKSSKYPQASENAPQQQYNQFDQKQDIFGLNNLMNQPTTLDVICSSSINQDQLWRLFDIIPDLDYCQINGENGRNCKSATVVYTNSDSALYAKEKLHGLEYPAGERLIVKLSEQSNSLGDVTFKREPSLCNVHLPPPAPMANSDATVVKSCFIVVSSHLPTEALKNVFSSFCNLVDVYLLPNKKCGYANYASEESARRAIDVLHGSEIMGVKIKVMEAEKPRQEERKRLRSEE